MNADRNTAVEPLLVDCCTASRMLSISPRMLWAMHAAGKVPLPIKIGRRTLFDLNELRQFIAARNPKTGLLPTREQWQTMKGNSK
jgi:predicted DNA-binding transcriptional regulator AlpA